MNITVDGQPLGERYEAVDGTYKMHAGDKRKNILFASELLSTLHFLWQDNEYLLTLQLVARTLSHVTREGVAPQFIIQFGRTTVGHYRSRHIDKRKNKVPINLK